MKKLSLRARVLTGTVAVAALGAGTFGAVSASASAPAAAPAAAVKADTDNRNLQQSTHLTVAAATKAAQ
ncbi:heme-binding protein, partial [Streptomyces sp. SID8455]|nr:heme-binding protein [Streptomyces sp. SID8455]